MGGIDNGIESLDVVDARDVLVSSDLLILLLNLCNNFFELLYHFIFPYFSDNKAKLCGWFIYSVCALPVV